MNQGFLQRLQNPSRFYLPSHQLLNRQLFSITTLNIEDGYSPFLFQRLDPLLGFHEPKNQINPPPRHPVVESLVLEARR